MRTNDPFIEIVNGIIIGEIAPPQKRALLLNVYTGETVASARGFESDEEARGWARVIVKKRKLFWGNDYQNKYPKGMELQIHG